MPNRRLTQAAITIHASPQRVWEALTTPRIIKRWFFGVDTEASWIEGGSIVHRGEYQGEPYEDKGTITRIEPEQLLVHTHWSPVSGLPDSAENYQQVSWVLTRQADGTELTVTEIDHPSEEAKEISERAWRAALASLKDVVEAA